MSVARVTMAAPFGRLAFREIGAGEPLVLLHGVGMQSEAWHPQLAALSASRHVVALDLPGHGASAPLPRDAGLQDFVAWCLTALDTLGLERVNLAGHSMGALIAAGVAATAPDRLLRVALLNGVYLRSLAARDAVLARARLIKDGAFDVETPLARWFSDSAEDRTARAQVQGWLSAMDLDGYATAYTAFARGDEIYAKDLAQIPCPLLALTGDGDPNSTPEMARQMAKAAPLGRAVILEGHRHMANLTAPEAVNAALSEWLEMPSPAKIPA